MATKTITKIFIANRGEIAVRIIKTCRKLGISTVVAFTDPDADSLAVKRADEAIYVGPPTAYLSPEAMINAALKTQCNALHPGFGFLSENAEFSKKVENAGLIFIGPSAESISAMGSKIEAKRILTQPKFASVVPVIPGYNGDDQHPATFLSQANRIGYPVLLKASAGGGGKGMRVLWNADHFQQNVEAAQREAKEGFGDPSLLLEKYFPAVRHVEIQIFADNYNDCVSMFERDCSIQRRHQKIIEETPSPQVSPQLRAHMGQVAVTIAKAIHYRNAGTVEFILDEHDHFYFLEVNTRLQVEHPITEAITGLDLVLLQIRVAEGYSLEQLGLHDTVPRLPGHALECRIYAEDPSNGFMPSPGRLIYYVPATVEGVRYDSGVESGSEISMFYDPMIAKVIAYGDTRQHCIARMIQALKHTVLVGLTTNLQFLLQVLTHADFQRGRVSTHFIEEHPDLTKETIGDEVYHAIASAAMLFLWFGNTQREPLHRHVTPGFRNVLYRNEYKTFRIDRNDFKVDYRVHPKIHAQHKDLFQDSHEFTVSIYGHTFPVTFHKSAQSQQTIYEKTGHASGFVVATIDHIRRSFFVYYVSEKRQLHIQSEGLQRPFVATFQPKLRVSEATSTSSNLYKAAMAGKIVSVSVSAGTAVSQGDVLVIMESMKMETKVTSRTTGHVKEVFVTAGQVVEESQSLVLFADQ